MTALALVHRRIVTRFGWLNMEGLVIGLVLAVALAAALLAFRAPAQADNPSAVQIRVPTAKAAAMVAATSVSAAQLRAVGDEAKMINAALPFSGAPIQAARPFDMVDGESDHRRALLCLTQAVYYEAGFEPLAGRKAVAQVVLNRMRHPAFPKSVCGVVYQGSRSPVCQFSFVCDGSLYRAPATGAWRQAQEVAKAALGGYVENSVGAATHYHADYVSPRWAPMLAKITRLGAHIFYRWPGAWGQRAAFTGRYIGEPNDPMALRPALRIASVGAGDTVVVDGSVLKVEAGPPIARAANDVGGLLDVSKGWKLEIPGPRDIPNATARAIGEQRSKPAPSPAVETAATAISAARVR